MTVANSIRKAGPFTGNGVTTSFPFSFKVFTSADLEVTLTAANGNQTVLTLDSHYSVSLNADQDNNPGGTITYPISGAKLSASESLTVLGDLAADQTTDITNLGNFQAQIHENAFDKLTILIQQLVEKYTRALVVPVNESVTPGSLPNAAGRAGRFLAFNASGDPVASAGSGSDGALRTDLAASGGSALVGFLPAGVSAVRRSAQDKMREWVSVKDYGAVGDGVTNDTVAIQAAIDAGKGAIFFPCPGTYRTTATLNVTSNDAILFGLSGRFANAYTSKIYLDHAGTGINIHNQSLLGAGLKDLVVERAAAHATSGTNIAVDSSGSGASTIVSHIDLDGVTSYKGAVGLLLRGLIFGTVNRMAVQNATTGISFPGAGATYSGGAAYQACNVLSLNDVSVQSATTAVSFAADAGCNIRFTNLDIESCTDTISVAAGCTVANVVFDMLWLEANTNGMKLRAGSHIHFGWVRHNNAAGIKLFDSATFAAKQVSVDTVIGSANDFDVGTAEVSVENIEIIANGGWASTVGNVSSSEANGSEYTPAVSAIQLAASSVMDVFRQSGRISKNYLVDWNITVSGNWSIVGATNMAAATDPLGGNTAYSWSGSVFGGCNAMPVVANGQTKEMTVWAYGSGRVKLQNWGRTFYWNINTTHWVRLPLRVVIENAATQAMEGLNLTLTPTSVGSLRVWRPGVYEGFDSIDSRPNNAFGAFEGGYIDLTTYVAGAREGTNLIFRGAAAPAAGTYMVGDKVVNTAPAAGGTEGWICTTGGAIGAGAVFKTFGTIAP